MSIFSYLGKYFLPGELNTTTSGFVVPHFLNNSNYYLPSQQQAEEISVIARWLVRLRWVAICGFLILALCFSLFFHTVLPIRPLYILCGIIFLYNLGFFLIFKTQKILTSWNELFSIRMQVVLDWLALFLFIHFTGGIFSPLVFFVILHIIINSMIFPQVQCYVYTTVSLMGLGTLILIENVLKLFPVNNLWLGKNVPEPEFIPMLIAFGLFSLMLYCATFLATTIMARFRQREDVVRRLSHNLKKALTRMETLYEATTVMVTSYDLNQVLDLLVKDSVRIMGAQGAALRLVEEGEEELIPAVTHGLSESYLHKGPITLGDGLNPKNPEDVIIVEDVEKDTRLSYPKETRAEGIRSIISLPLVTKGTIIGNLRLYAKTTHHFTRDEISFLKILANGAAVIIDNVQAWKALEESNKKIVSFAYKIGHDLKSPVSAVQGLLTAMQEGYAGEVPQKQKDILTRCINKQEQLLLLIRDLLNLAEGQIATDGQKVMSIVMNTVAAETVKLLEAVSQQKGVSIVSSLPEQPIQFEEIPGDFHRLFSNLLDNAIRYTPSGGTVDLVLETYDTHITIRVRDTGIGIEPEYMGNIFEEFFRTPHAKKCIADGTGLGLAIVKGIVNRYHGSIHVESELGKGTAFFITFPKSSK